MDSILDPLGLPFGSLLAPKMAETSLGIPLGAAKSRSRALCFDPRALQDRTKRHLRALQEASRRLRHSKKPPGSHSGPIWLLFVIHLDSILSPLSTFCGLLADDQGFVSLPRCCKHAVCEVASFGGAAPCEIYNYWYCHGTIMMI